jgi:Ni/Co efflux regulator RcnB
MRTTRFIALALAGLMVAGGATAEAKDRHSRHRHDHKHRHYRHHHHNDHHHHRRHHYHSGPAIGLSLSYLATPRVVQRPVYVAGDRLVADVQHALNRRGYPAGPADGIMGSRTRNAILAYQRNNGLYPTGTINEALLRSLRI